MARITKARQAEIAEYLVKLREHLATVETIYTLNAHTARSGMLRCIRPFIITTDSRPWDITFMVARAGIGDASERHGGIEMGGCGMDMGFSLVYNIGRAVIAGEPWSCRGDRCPSNDHINAPRVPRGPDIVHTGDGGYRFRQEWL